MSRWRWLLIPMVMLLVSIFAISIYSAEGDFLKEGGEGGIAFVSGGVGQEGREILKGMGKEYTLKLIFSNKKGEYLSDVVVKVLDHNDKTILTTVSNGPWLFINLPSGTYHLETGLRDNEKKISRVHIEKGTQKVVSIQW